MVAIMKSRSLLLVSTLLGFGLASPQRGIGGCGCREVICPNQGPDVGCSGRMKIVELGADDVSVALCVYQRCGGRLLEVSEGRLSAATGKNNPKRASCAGGGNCEVIMG